MPELNDVIETDEVKTTNTVSTVEVTTIDDDEKKELPKTETKPLPKPAAKKTVAKKPVAKTSKTTNSTVTTESTTENDESNEATFRRPPMEQLTKDFERHVLTLKIGDQLIKKLGYKCGKIIYGLENSNGKDFRVIAFKARKKTKTVAGKSRCIFYFGITKDLTNITKQHAGTSTTEFGSCSVQTKKPIQLILDKVTFAKKFDQDIEKVMTILKDLCAVTIEHKTEQWNSLQEKVETKKKAAETKSEKPKTKKKPVSVSADAE
jgi:hypothetical protein